MRIKKRTLPMYLLLNCLTLGIYGFIVAAQMNKEIDALCKGDKQNPGMSYPVAWAFSKIIGFGTIYYNYRWYQQANRMHMNANRYGLTIKETGTDIFLMRTALGIALILVTVAEIAMALILPLILSLLLGMLSPVVGIVFFALCVIVLLLFGNELTAGANMANYYLMKNLNRYADVYRNGATEFNAMTYEYYPSVSNNYGMFICGNFSGKVSKVDDREDIIEYGPSDEGKTIGHVNTAGSLIGLKGACAGYKFELISGEEIIIGKDAKFSSVVIDPSFKEISRKHVGICYDMVNDQYRVVDYSSNGTWANGTRLVNGQAVYLSHGAELKLANEKNTFVLG